MGLIKELYRIVSIDYDLLGCMVVASMGSGLGVQFQLLCGLQAGQVAVLPWSWPLCHIPINVVFVWGEGGRMNACKLRHEEMQVEGLG